MIHCLAPIAQSMRSRALANAAAGRLPPVPLAAPPVAAPQAPPLLPPALLPGPPQFPGLMQQPMQQPMPPMLQMMPPQPMPAYNPYGQTGFEQAAALSAYHNYFAQRQGHAHGQQGLPPSPAAL